MKFQTRLRTQFLLLVILLHFSPTTPPSTTRGKAENKRRHETTPVNALKTEAKVNKSWRKREKNLKIPSISREREVERGGNCENLEQFRVAC